MKDNYIEKKLKEFDESFIMKNFALYNKKRDIMATTTEIRLLIEQALTDYHNHIVDKIKNELGDFAHTKYEGCTREDGKDYYWYENEVIYIVDEYFKSLLQDTNK